MATRRKRILPRHVYGKREASSCPFSSPCCWPSLSSGGKKKKLIMLLGLLFVAIDVVSLQLQQSLLQQESLFHLVMMDDTVVGDSVEVVPLSLDPSRQQSASTVAATPPTTGNMNTNEKKRHSNGKPTLTLHVGPPKTATTFLQCSLCANRAVTDQLLLQDNTVYLGTCPYRACGLSELPVGMLPHRHDAFFHKNSSYTWEPGSNSLGPVPHGDRIDGDTASAIARQRRDESSLPTISALLQELLDAARDQNLNALVIFEGSHKFSAAHIQALADSLFDKWNVEIVVAYRRLTEWLPSKYNSITKGHLGTRWPARLVHDVTNGTATPAGIAAGNQQQKREKRKGKVVQGFHMDDRGDFSKLVQLIESTGQHPTEIVRDNYARQFEHVRILDLHNLQTVNDSVGDAYLEHLLCHVVQAANACAAVQAGLIGASSAGNPSESFHYDILAVYAYQHGIYTGIQSRGKVTSLVKRRQETLLGKTVKDFPTECLPERDVDRLLQLSLSTEHSLFGKAWTSKQEAEHRASFSRALEKNKYCSIDAAKTLQDPEWREFFERLA